VRTQLILGILVGLGTGGCAHTRDISSTPQYKPWIGKTVKLRDGPQNYNIYAPTWHSYFINTSASYSDYPIVANLPRGYPVIIDAVKETKGIYLIGGPYTHVHSVLSMELPNKKKKWIKVHSELDDVEPFRDRKGHKLGSDWH
jgi:hypothetical protein